MTFVKLTSYVKSDEWGEDKGIMQKGTWDEHEAIINADDVLLVFPTNGQAPAGESVVRFKNGFQVTVKEDVDQLLAMFNGTEVPPPKEKVVPSAIVRL